MKYTKNVPVLVLLFLSSYIVFTSATTFDVINRCNYTVWAAVSTGGGKRLDQGQSWRLNVAPGTTSARIWGRTKCNFDANGQGQCETGDCGKLECPDQSFGKPPNTLAEFALNQPNNVDYFDISLVDGFNIPMEFSSVTPCRTMRCTAPIVEQCPAELRAPGGCNNPCTVFQTNEYCCTNGSGTCAPTNFSRFFKERCPDAYIYPQDARTSLFSCPSGTNYRVVFCP